MANFHLDIVALELGLELPDAAPQAIP